jgi:hypothetical protein
LQTDTVEELVLVPLNKMVAMLNGPNNVIDKRFDKLLDYNNLMGRGKDEKVTARITQEVKHSVPTEV